MGCSTECAPQGNDSPYPAQDSPEIGRLTQHPAAPSKQGRARRYANRWFSRSLLHESGVLNAVPLALRNSRSTCAQMLSNSRFSKLKKLDIMPVDQNGLMPPQVMS